MPADLTTGTTPDSAVTDVREAVHRLATELNGPLHSVRVRSGEVSIEVEWSPGDRGGATAQAPVETAQPEDDGRLLVVSPMVGTFYRAPEPGAAPFVTVGDAVEVGQVIGIVEAMKLMNPIVSDHAGTVAEVFTADAEPVEFEQPLLSVVPAEDGIPS